jgi:anti-sigma factor RsiW
MTDESLDRLIDAHLNGEMTEAERHELEERLLHSAADRARFWQLAETHAVLHEALQRQLAGSAPRADILPRVPLPVAWSRRLTGSRRWIPFAVGSCAALLALLVWAMRPAPQSHRGGEAPSGRGYVAELRRADGAVWAPGSPRLEEGQMLRASALKLVAGRVELRFFEGATVAMQGPAAFRVLSADRMLLEGGVASADVPPSAIGFTIVTPESEVRDRGTRFGVAVKDSGVTETHVFEGKVDVFPGVPSGETGKARRLLASEAIAVGPQWGQVAAIEARPAAFPLPVRSLEIAVPCRGFELDAPAWGDSNGEPPRAFGVWGGALCERTGAQDGIVPRTGAGMLHFLEASKSLTPGVNALASERWCWIDLRPYRGQWQNRRVTAEFSAWFNNLPGDRHKLTAHRVIAATFGPGSQPGPETWWLRLDRKKPGCSLSNSETEIRPDDDVTTWELVATTVTIPPDAELLMLAVHIRSDEPDSARRCYDGAYCDDAQLTIRLGEAISPGPLAAAKHSKEPVPPSKQQKSRP